MCIVAIDVVWSERVLYVKQNFACMERDSPACWPIGKCDTLCWQDVNEFAGMWPVYFKVAVRRQVQSLGYRFTILQVFFVILSMFI